MKYKEGFQSACFKTAGVVGQNRGELTPMVPKLVSLCCFYLPLLHTYYILHYFYKQQPLTVAGVCKSDTVRILLA